MRVPNIKLIVSAESREARNFLKFIPQKYPEKRFSGENV